MRWKRLAGCKFDSIDSHAFIFGFELVLRLVGEGGGARTVRFQGLYINEPEFDGTRICDDMRVPASGESHSTNAGDGLRVGIAG